MRAELERLLSRQFHSRNNRIEGIDIYLAGTKRGIAHIITQVRPLDIYAMRYHNECVLVNRRRREIPPPPPLLIVLVVQVLDEADDQGERKGSKEKTGDDVSDGHN